MSGERTNVVLTHKHTELSGDTLSWAFDDANEPTEITIFDRQHEVTTHWITMNEDDVYDLNESV